MAKSLTPHNENKWKIMKAEAETVTVLNKVKVLKIDNRYPSNEAFGNMDHVNS
jgi:hypothetical protein